MARKTTLDEAIAAAATDRPARTPRKVRPMSKRGRPQSDTSPSTLVPIHGPSEIAEMLGYQRDAVYEWEKKGLERADNGKGFHLPDVVRWLMARERAAGRLEADPDDALQAEQLRDLRARADMREDQRDLQRKQLIEVELAVAVYEDDTAYVAVHLRNLGARLMGTLCTMDDPAEICAVIDAEVERALENLNSAHVDPASPDAHPIVGGVMIEGRG